MADKTILSGYIVELTLSSSNADVLKYNNYGCHFQNMNIASMHFAQPPIGCSLAGQPANSLANCLQNSKFVSQTCHGLKPWHVYQYKRYD